MAFGVIINHGKIYTLDNPVIAGFSQEMEGDGAWSMGGIYRTRTTMSIELAAGTSDRMYTETPLLEGQDELQQAIELIIEEKIRRAVKEQTDKIKTDSNSAQESLNKIKALLGVNDNAACEDYVDDTWDFQ